MSTDEARGEQLALVAGTPTRKGRPGRGPGSPGSPGSAAPQRPVARVLVDVELPHLDRPFDYAVPATLDAAARDGVRVRVRFAGRLVDGFLLERVEETTYGGRLAPLAAVVSPEPVLSQPLARLVRSVADRYAGSAADVLRLAVPPRHARAEREEHEQPSPRPPVPPVPGGWTDYPDGAAFLDALRAGAAPRAVWNALPGDRWPTEVATAVAATLAGGRGSVVVVPDHRDLDRVDAAVTAALGPDRHVVLRADLGPERRYRRWLAVRRGERRVVLGTRAAAFAPVDPLGLLVVWDDGDDLHEEPRAPYPHVREVLALRSAQAGAGLLLGGFARTAEGAALLESGWARPLAPARDRVRAAAPRVRLAGEDAELARDDAARSARLPTLAWLTARRGLEHGPVLVQVPRAGYLAGLACADCRAAARCPACHGPLGAQRGQPPACRWCGRPAVSWTCPSCAATRLRATAVGAVRTAEELGRAFPGVPVRSSAGDAVLATVDARPALVVSTPGAEPVAPGGYTAALLLDGWALLNRPDLRAAEEALRRWLAAATLVRPAADGGVVVLVADPSAPAAQALVRFDPAGFAARELAERAELGFPPAAALASLTGPPDAVAGLVAAATLPPGTERLGPVVVHASGAGRPAAEPAERLLLRVPRGQGRALAAALHAAAGVRSAHKDVGAVRIQVDPTEIA